MAKRTLNEFEQAIIDLRGKSNTETIVLNKLIIGVYTWKGDVCVLKEGQDIDFNSLPLDEQEKISNEVVANNWTVDESFVG